MEYYTQSAISTGDFDLCTPQQEAFEAIMRQHGFVRPSGPGQLTKGWVHPALKLGFEIVARVPMDGSVDPGHVLLIEEFAEDGAFAVISVEDLIADRMGQYASGTARDRIDQARTLLALHPDAEMAYLERRPSTSSGQAEREESMGDYGVEDIES